jgi:hypothetical protein
MRTGLIANRMAASTASALYGKESFQVLSLNHPLVVAFKHDELDERGHLMESAEGPDKKNDWNRYADQPKQKTSSHNFFLFIRFSVQRNVRA